MFVMGKQKKHLDYSLIIIIVLVMLAFVYADAIIEYICTHNILKGQF